MKTQAAAILAGGYGRRLRETSAVSHKSLLKLTDGKTIIGRMIKQLYENGINRIYVVHFFPSDENLISEALDQAKLMNIELSFVRQNPSEEYGTLYALKNIFKEYKNKNELIIAEGDVVCHDKVIHALSRSSGTILVIDDNVSADAEAMKAVCKNDKITFLSKAISGYSEFCGLLRFTEKDRRQFLKYADAVTLEEPFYEDALNIIAARENAFPFLRVSKNDWTEIDTADDFDEAKKKMMRW